MDQTINSFKTQITDEESSAAKLLTSSKNLQNIRILKEPKQEIDKSCSLKKEQGRNSPPAWNLQKERIPEGADVVRVYKRRWLMLVVFFVYAVIGTFQWSMYSIIANIITKYYDVSSLSVDFTTLSYLISYLATFLPAGWILNNLGLRWAMLISCSLNALGCFVRIFSVPCDRFWLAMTGQCIVGLSQVFVLMIPARLAAVWFPANQVSFACAFAFNGILVGNAVGFLAPPILVQNSDDLFDIAKDLDRLYLGVAALAISAFILTALFFQEKPPLPPSQAQRVQRSDTKNIESLTEFSNTMKGLVTKKSYMILLISCALIVGVFCTIVTMLNQILIPHFPGREKEVGLVGLVLIVSGIVSSAMCGFILDQTHAFKKTTISLYLFTLAGWIAFAVLVQYGNMSLIYVSSAILGFATTGVQPVLMEFGVEVTFPVSETSASGLMYASVQASGVLFTLAYGYVLEYWGDVIANAVLAAPLVVGCTMSFFIRPRLKRQAARRTRSPLDDIRC